jgi:hypothetical protein
VFFHFTGAKEEIFAQGTFYDDVTRFAKACTRVLIICVSLVGLW